MTCSSRLQLGRWKGMLHGKSLIDWGFLQRYDTEDFDPKYMTEEQLNGAPNYKPGTEYDWSQTGGGKRVHDYYGTQPYWTF